MSFFCQEKCHKSLKLSHKDAERWGQAGKQGRRFGMEDLIFEGPWFILFWRIDNLLFFWYGCFHIFQLRVHGPGLLHNNFARGTEREAFFQEGLDRGDFWVRENETIRKAKLRIWPTSSRKYWSSLLWGDLKRLQRLLQTKRIRVIYCEQQKKVGMTKKPTLLRKSPLSPLGGQGAISGYSIARFQ